MPGGAAFNVASLLAALGQDARLHSIAGADEAADRLRAVASARRVLLDLQRSDAEPTASYTAILGPGGDLVIALADMAIYDRFEVENAAPAPDDGDWMLIDANLSPETITRLVRRRSGPVAAMTVSAAKALRLHPTLGDIDLLFTNRAELAALCGMTEDAPLETVLIAFGRLGGNDAVVSDGAGDVWWRLDGTIRHTSTLPAARIVDATGAGDGLTAGCLHALMARRPMDEAVAFGIRVARAVLSVEGPWHPDLPSALSLAPEA